VRTSWVRAVSGSVPENVNNGLKAITSMKLSAAEKHRRQVERIAHRLSAMSPQNRINDVAKAFQRLVRMLQADKHGNCTCVTCGKVTRWDAADMNAGHFVSRSRHATVFHFINCHPQCAACNKHKAGNASRYEEYMVAKHGREVVDELKICGEQKLRWTCEQLAEKKIQFLDMQKDALRRLPVK
jgi:hypothetical protein